MNAKEGLLVNKTPRVRHPSCGHASSRNFSNRLIWDDALHVAWLGFAPDFVASVLVDMFGNADALLRAHDLAKH